MLSKNTLLHLRFPFSFFLMPVFCFAVSVAQPLDWQNVWLVFFILHFLLYPASNGYNSYFDKDEDSIGGLEKPPPVSKELFYTAWAMDLGAILLGWWVSNWFAVNLLIYGLVSKAYSHDAIRLKKYPILSWLTIGFFQGAFTFWMVYQAVLQTEIYQIFESKSLWAGLLSSWMLLGSYPMTQIYQHKEDARRGDQTLSLLLGIKGTFLFTLMVFGMAGLGYFIYFSIFSSWLWGGLFMSSLIPVVVYFLMWMYQVWQNENAANFRATMRLNLISAICMNLFFIAWGVFR